MPEFLEAVMMVCFGISWPINAVNAYRSGTAKSTSPLIAADKINYVLAVYLINFMTVACNLVIYCINRRKDHQRGLSGTKE